MHIAHRADVTHHAPCGRPPSATFPSARRPSRQASAATRRRPSPIPEGVRLRKGFKSGLSRTMPASRFPLSVVIGKLPRSPAVPFLPRFPLLLLMFLLGKLFIQSPLQTRRITKIDGWRSLRATPLPASPPPGTGCAPACPKRLSAILRATLPDFRGSCNRRSRYRQPRDSRRNQETASLTRSGVGGCFSSRRPQGRTMGEGLPAIAWEVSEEVYISLHL